MAAIAAPRATLQELSCFDMKHDHVVAAGKTIYHGTWVGVDADFKCVPADEAVKVLGRASCANLVSAAEGETVRIDQGIFCWVDGVGVDGLAMGDPVYAADNQTTDVDSGNGPFGGILHRVDSNGAWVLSGLGITDPTDLIS